MEKQTKTLGSPLPMAIIIAGTIVAVALIYVASPDRQLARSLPGALKEQAVQAAQAAHDAQDVQVSALEESVVPSGGVALPVSWGVMGQNLIKAGVIKADEFQAIYEARKAFTGETQRLLSGTTTEKLVITRDNAGVLLNLFWALGLAQKSPILEQGEIMNPNYGDAGNFASTGGWTLAQGKAMEHYSYHTFFTLSADSQALVEKISLGIYRPCCGNSVHFPDCNHGMAMLGLLELMASQGASEKEMWKAALAVNSYWFPDTYITIATYMKDKGVEWKDVEPREMLGTNYSSQTGYAKIAAQVTAPAQKSGNSGCAIDAVDNAKPAPTPQRQQSGCAL